MIDLNTARLRIRKISEQDFERFFEIFQEEEVRNNVGWNKEKDVNKIAMHIHAYVKKSGVYAIELLNSGLVIGSIGIHHDRHDSKETTKMVGIMLDKNYWGKGYAAEAIKAVIHYLFTETDCLRVSSGHFGSNTQTSRVFEKVGLKYNCFFEKDFKPEEGYPLDVIYYTLDKSNYKE